MDASSLVSAAIPALVSASQDLGISPAALAVSQQAPELDATTQDASPEAFDALPGLSSNKQASAELIKSLSADMHAAMQQLLGTSLIDTCRNNATSTSRLGNDIQASGNALQGSQAHAPGPCRLQSSLQRDTGLSVARDPAAVAEQLDSTAVLQADRLQVPAQAHQAMPTHVPTMASSLQQQHPQQQPQPQQSPGGVLPWGRFRLPRQSPSAMSDPAGAIGRGFSGMQLHLMHQLEGLERSVQGIEEQVRSNKQTRRLLKAVSTPVQVLLHTTSAVPCSQPIMFLRLPACRPAKTTIESAMPVWREEMPGS